MEEHKAKTEQEARAFLGGFGLVGELALQMIGSLSGGQKARLAFATVSGLLIDSIESLDQWDPSATVDPDLYNY
jgi:ABC-type polar amino acid transport system ATPase subunit